MNFFPITQAHPQRAPYSRPISYIDEAGPPPCEFFDQVQDSLGTYAHTRTGWAWSAGREDFNLPLLKPGLDAAGVATNFLGDFMVDPLANIGIALTPLATAFQGEHGVWKGEGQANNILFRLVSGECHMGAQDWLVSCKVHCIKRDELDTYQNRGFYIGTGPLTTNYPAVACGGDVTTWQVWAGGQWWDSGVTFLDTTNMGDGLRRAWNVIQISKVSGAVRVFINGKLVRLGGKEGVYYGAPGVTGAAEMPVFYRIFEMRRPAGFYAIGSTGFYLDYFHQLARRA